MYGFRYHVVTVAAIFMALGMGLLLGGLMGPGWMSATQEDVFSRMEEKYLAQKTENSRLLEKTTDLDLETRRTSEQIRTIADHIIQDQLSGVKVLVVQLDPSEIPSMYQALSHAGAQVVSTIHLINPTPWQDPSLQTWWANEVGGTPQLGPEELARLGGQLVAKDIQDAIKIQSGQASMHLIKDLQKKGIVEISGSLQAPVDRIIVVGGSGTTERQRIDFFDTAFFETMLQSYRLPNLVAVERSNVAISGVTQYSRLGISTVDNVDQIVGEIALVEILRGEQGHFGIKSSAESLLPKDNILHQGR